MSHATGITDFPTFKEAATWCRNFALEHQVSIRLQRKGSRWQALIANAPFVPPKIIANTDMDCMEDAGYLDDDPPEADCDLEFRGELAEEIASDREDWARSDEDGWFYSDD